MIVVLKRVYKDKIEEEVDVVEACRDRAAEHMQQHLNGPVRKKSEFPEYEAKPVDLWTAKLLLEIADLFQKTGP